MLVRTADVIGRPLDYLVAKCEGYQSVFTDGSLTPVFRNGQAVEATWPSYSTDPVHGWPIIEQKIDNLERRIGYFYAHRFKRHGRVDSSFKSYPDEKESFAYGPTSLVASMRCYVISKLGKEVEIPEELIND